MNKHRAFTFLKINICYAFLKFMPLFTFPAINNFFFRLMGYNIHKSALIFSSAKILGDIEVMIGEKTFIGHETVLIGGLSKIQIGKNCDISSRVSIISGSHIIDMENERSAGEGIGKDVIIEDGVWIGASSIILPGVKIGYKSIIGAGSVVCKDIPCYCIAVGNPCIPIKEWNNNGHNFQIIKNK